MHPAETGTPDLERLVEGAAYRAILAKLMDAVKEYGLVLWLSDGRRSGAILPRTSNVLDHTGILPQVTASGLAPDRYREQRGPFEPQVVDRMVNDTLAEATYAAAFFEDPAIAQLWLMDPSKTNVVAAWSPGQKSSGA
ncbi:MAG: hypothetical protein R2818_05300 [Flavobacteriales bacterium]